MTDHISEVLLLPAEETSLDEQSQFAILEDKERPTATQIILKRGDSFLVADVCGDFLSTRQEMGTFWHGTRFLRTCNLFLEGRPLAMLSHHITDVGDACQIDLTNTALMINGEMIVEQGAIHVRRLLELHNGQLVQTITLTSFHNRSIPFNLSLKIGADFCDLFEVRGFLREKRGVLQRPRQVNTTVLLGYQGLDGVERSTALHFSPRPDQISHDRVSWDMHLTRGQAVEIRVTIKMSQSDVEGFASSMAVPTIYQDSLPTLYTDNHFFNRLLERGIHDLTMLCTITPYGAYPYAGTPWFSCPFGRDGLITSLEFLPWFPEVVRGTLAFLAAYQGKRVEPFTDEEPGKILHEFRTGEMANCREIPYIPYYGSVDVTPLFLITLEAYIRWTNDMEFLAQLWPHAEAAACWLAEYGDHDGDGFIEYHKASEKGLVNQGWKDAWDSVSDGDGKLVTGPIALCEVQGYTFAAYRALSYLAGRLGKNQQAGHWQEQATSLQANFLRRFWWEEEHAFYLALDGDKRPCNVVSSNAGQCLWTGIVPEDKARLVIARLMREDMNSGWGLRTLSTHAARYNPMSYHNGSVWPHDTALVGAGFARNGGKAEAWSLLQGIYSASHHFERARLPELYCGFARRHEYGPTRYPVACEPQAWAAGAPFCLLSALLGFEADAEHNRLLLHHPTLPDWLHMLDITGLRLGQHHIRLRFVRVGENTNVILEENAEVDIQVR